MAALKQAQPAEAGEAKKWADRSIDIDRCSSHRTQEIRHATSNRAASWRVVTAELV